MSADDRLADGRTVAEVMAEDAAQRERDTAMEAAWMESLGVEPVNGSPAPSQATADDAIVDRYVDETFGSVLGR